ncbi:MAG: tRNA 2-thiouridine(34) synthase MnmA [Candidatus Acidiferrales bacterium]
MSAIEQIDLETRRASLALPEGTTAVAMSGGVDSSAVAALLATRGQSVIGLTMQLWNQRRLPGMQAQGRVQHRCCSLDDVYDARRVAEHLSIPFYVVNFERAFEETVIRPFVADYLAARTPIPCTLCNNHVKFDELIRFARQIGAERIATGHYARVRHNSTSGRYELSRAADDAKDQTYFLFGLTQEQLSRTEFPLGAMKKADAREIARQARLPVADKPESQEICFVPSGDYVHFIEDYLGEQGSVLASDSGEIVDIEGQVLGPHDGLHHFTIGQRKGLGFAAGRPLYVVAIDRAANRVIVGDDAALRSDRALLRGVNWVSIARPQGPVMAMVKIRHRHEPAEAEIIPVGPDSAEIRFCVPQRAITPGQAAVFYSSDLVLGGGWIS